MNVSIDQSPRKKRKKRTKIRVPQSNSMAELFQVKCTLWIIDYVTVLPIVYTMFVIISNEQLVQVNQRFMCLVKLNYFC